MGPDMPRKRLSEPVIPFRFTRARAVEGFLLHTLYLSGCGRDLMRPVGFVDPLLGHACACQLIRGPYAEYDDLRHDGAEE